MEQQRINRGCECRPGTCALGVWAWCERRGHLSSQPFGGVSAHLAIERRAACGVATRADGFDFQRVEVIAVVVMDGGLAAVNASAIRCAGQVATLDGSAYLVDGALLFALALFIAVEAEQRARGRAVGWASATDAVHLCPSLLVVVRGERVGQLARAALNGFEVREQRLDGFQSRVVALEFVCQLSQRDLSKARVAGNSAPSRGASLSELAS